MILKWLANFWLRWPRCQKPSPYPGPLMAIDADQSWNGGFTLPCMGPWMTPSPKASQKFQKTRSFWNSVNLRGQGNRLWQKGQKKARAEQGVAMELKRILHNLRFEKGFEIFPKRFNSSISFRSSPSHRTQLRLLKPWLLQSMRSMADPSYQGTLEPIGVVQ